MQDVNIFAYGFISLYSMYYFLCFCDETKHFTGDDLLVVTEHK